LHDRFKTFWYAPESGNWINAIISRFWLNVQESAELKKKFTERISLRLAEKIEEKNLQDYIVRIVPQPVGNISLLSNLISCALPRIMYPLKIYL